MPSKGNVITGARARVLINGVRIGYATNVSVNEETQYEPVEVIDDFEVSEHVPVGFRVSGSIGFIRTFGESIKSLGFRPAAGQSSEEHLENVINAAEITMALEDKIGGQSFRTLTDVKFSSESIQVMARGLSATDVSFVAIRSKDESEV